MMFQSTGTKERRSEDSSPSQSSSRAAERGGGVEFVQGQLYFPFHYSQISHVN